MAVSLGGRRITGTNFPYTNDAAKPRAFVLIPPAKRIISVQDANYRLSTISGNFLIYKNKQIKIRKNGDRVIEVICYWYTWRPPKKKIYTANSSEERNGYDFNCSNVGHSANCSLKVKSKQLNCATAYGWIYFNVFLSDSH